MRLERVLGRFVEQHVVYVHREPDDSYRARVQTLTKRLEDDAGRTQVIDSSHGSSYYLHDREVLNSLRMEGVPRTTYLRLFPSLTKALGQLTFKA